MRLHRALWLIAVPALAAGCRSAHNYADPADHGSAEWRRPRLAL